MANSKILIVDDEVDICDLIEMTLSSNGFSNIKSVHDGKSAIQMATDWAPDMVLLDLMLPEVDGLGVCKELKSNEKTSKIPIIILTAKSTEHDIVTGLELGADDYITKPFSNKVLVARIKARLRDCAKEILIKYKELVININEHSVFLDGEALELTYSEFQIITAFAKRPGRVYSRLELISMLRGDDGFETTQRAIDVQIVNLRKKLGDFGSNIETVRGVGYRFKGLS